MTSSTSIGVAGYARAVRDELRDLSPEAAHAILDGLDEHLAEIVAEGTSDLEVALGPPKAYAAELRASAVAGSASTRDIGDTADHEMPMSAEPEPSGRWVAAARGLLVAVLGVLAVVVIRASHPANGLTIVAIAAVVGGAWWLLDALGERAALPESWSTRLPITLAGAATVFAVLLGAQLAEDGQTTYVDNFPMQTAVPSFADEFVQVPDVLGFAYRDAVRVLNESGFAVIVEGAETSAVESMVITATFPGPGESARSDSVISLTFIDTGAVSPQSTVGPLLATTTVVVTTAPESTVVATELPMTSTTLAADGALVTTTIRDDSSVGVTTTWTPYPSPPAPG